MAYSLTLVLLSGPIASGKTTLARDLARQVFAEHLSTSGLMAASAGRELDRSELQRRGSDATFLGAGWIIDAVRQIAARAPSEGVVVIDAIRTLAQAEEIRKAGAGTWQILHVHLRGEISHLAARHQARSSDDAPWDQVMSSPTEAAAQTLEAEADVVIETTHGTPEDVATRVAARVSRTRAYYGDYVDVLVGGQWGSEGKGNLAFFIAPEYDLLVRVGAPNAGHKIRTPAGLVYTHRQLPSGTRATDSPLLLGPGAVIDTVVLMREIADCQISAERLAIDPGALVIEPGDVQRETGLKHAIGSTGTGGGAALARRIEQRGTPGVVVRTAKDVTELAPYLRDSGSVLEQARSRGGRVFIEGTQGTGLSILHGSFPHVTSRDTTVSTLLAEVGVRPQQLRRVIVAFRSYPIRVGGESGPMGREITWDTVARRAGLPADLLKSNERGSVSGNPRRVAEFSWSQLRQSARLNGATDLALTFADYLDVRNQGARRFSQLTDGTIEMINEMESVAAARVSFVSANFDGRGPIDRRLW